MPTLSNPWVVQFTESLTQQRRLVTARMTVHGGWLYRVLYETTVDKVTDEKGYNSPGYLSLVFVPDSANNNA